MARAAANGNGGGFISRQNFQAALGALSVLFILFGSFGGYVISSLSARIDEIKLERVAQAEFRQYGRRVDETLLRLDVTLLRLTEQIVPRGEHGEKWRANDAAFLTQQRQIDELRRDLSAIFPTTKVVEELFKRVDRLETGKVGSGVPH